MSYAGLEVLVLYNPACGDNTAKEFFEAHVLPRLECSGINPSAVVATEGVGHAETIVIDFLKQHEGEVAIVLGSGDGTLHEIINALAFSYPASSSMRRAIPFVLVPCGTANALFSSLFLPSKQDPVMNRLSSLDAFIARSKPKPLALAYTSLLSGAPQHNCLHTVISVVVTSTALHASILKDSELLRKDMPGIERFKVAAQQNITRWYRSRVKLLPISSTGVVQVYDPDTDAFIPYQGPLDMSASIAYFLSTVNVDRLEPAFLISPLFSRIPSHHISLDLVIVRPERDPTFIMDTPTSREAFARKTGVLFAAAYQDGNHIRLRYRQDGDIGHYDDGPTVVEYFRCGGWEWVPDEADERAHLICSDGTVLEIAKGGKAVCNAIAAIPNGNVECLVYT
ncbi:ATP-NAD kinase-like domain-containing protein [Scleroderma citrinum]